MTDTLGQTGKDDPAITAAETDGPRLPYSFAKEHGVAVLSGADDNTSLTLAFKKGADPASLLEVTRVLGSNIRLEHFDQARFDKLLSETYAVGDFSSSGITEDMDRRESLDSLVDDIPKTADLLDSDDDAPVIRLINGVIAEAVKDRGSDIHIEPFENGLSVRLRIDGVLTEILDLPARVAPLLVSRIKVMARLDIAEKRIPQDGRISLALGGRALDVRVSTLPSRYGERVVMRLLDRDQAQFSVEDLGMTAETRSRFEAVLREPNGVFLVTGPTGSGKTTTLYAGLSYLNDKTRNILTVEDPVEYAIDGIGQTQVNARVGMTFAAGLRAMLRQDPDVVMVGEIRDKETADIAVQASLTGHLVLSTIHTNSAVAAIPRLRDMGVESFLLASTLKGILAQRLVRQLCPHCKEPTAPDATARKVLGLEGAHSDATLFRPVGCHHCSGTGYLGRIGIYELVVVTDTLAELIHEDRRERELADLAFETALTLKNSGYNLVRAGVTTLEEVMRVVRQDGDSDAAL